MEIHVFGNFRCPSCAARPASASLATSANPGGHPLFLIHFIYGMLSFRNRAKKARPRGPRGPLFFTGLALLLFLLFLSFLFGKPFILVIKDN